MKAPCPACRVGSCPRSRFLPHTCTRPPCRASREVTALGSGHPTQAAVILGSSGEKAGGVGLHIRVSLSPHPTVLQDTPPGLCFGDPNSLFSSRMFVSSSFSWPVENLSAGGSGHPSCLPPNLFGGGYFCTLVYCFPKYKTQKPQWGGDIPQQGDCVGLWCPCRPREGPRSGWVHGL